VSATLETARRPLADALVFAQLNRSACKTYLVACRRTGAAMLVDPLLGEVDRYLRELEEHGLFLRMVVDTHVHADHLSGGAAIRARTGVDYVMHALSTATCANRRVEDGDTLVLGDLTIGVLHTPGHTQDGITLVLPDRLLTGDFLFIGEGGAGRTDLPGGDPGDHWDALQKLSGRPDDLLIFPAHDYHGRIASTLGAERRDNPRLRPLSRADYVREVSRLDLGPAAWMADVIRANYACATALDAAWIPPDAPVCEAGGTAGSPAARLSTSITAEALAEALREPATAPLVLDVRQPEELAGELGWIAGARNIPLGELSTRLGELAGLEHRPIACVCQKGGRSSTAAAVLATAGFERVTSLAGGMERWSALRLPVDKLVHGALGPAR
jgi:glyoxylase-like metal-dependent hydrolase (beta-lactamase superfamily II)/rhodanese-related sulfurtransferase